ncbi:hypothetical protein ECPA15_0436, partial [Escherichia coli PA15]|jgi:hypothetical protein
MTYL